MSELSAIGKIKQALEYSCLAHDGCSLSYFDVLELLGYIKDLEAEIYMTEETVKPDGNLGILSIKEQLDIATDLGEKRWKALNDIYENAQKHNVDWCRRKAEEGLKIRKEKEDGEK